jgi:hypothetical protein
MEPLSITATIALIKSAIVASKKLDNLEIKDALIAAREALNEQRDVNLLVKDENNTLKEELSDMKKRIESKSSIVESVDCYEKKVENGQSYAVCSHCWEVDGIAVTLAKIPTSYPTCPRCKNYFTNIEKHKFINLS